MIPQAAITERGRTVPWPTVEQIEQDLLLSRLMVECANDDYLGEELVFRGGICLHKLHAPEPLRYSEDLDLEVVRSHATFRQHVNGSVVLMRASLLDHVDAEDITDRLRGAARHV